MAVKQITIYPIDVDGTEFLPLEQDTPLYTKPDYLGMSDVELRNIFIYRAIQERENYYQDHTPPAFGDPTYSRLDGYMFGLVYGYGLEIDDDIDRVIVKTKTGRIIMTVVKPKTTEAYKETVRDNNRTLREFGL